MMSCAGFPPMMPQVPMMQPLAPGMITPMHGMAPMQTGLVPAPAAATPAAVGASGQAEVKLTNALIENLAVGKVHRDHKGPMTGMDFTHDGMHLVTCGEDSSVYVYSCERAHSTRHLRCEKYGVGLIKFLHNDKDAAVAASRGGPDHVLKYWDFHENRYIRLFRGHEAPAVSVSPHPYEDIFLSGSEDKSVMLWDLRQDSPTAKITGQATTVASFDQQGLVFAACVGRPKIHLFDTRNYAKGEFTCFDLAPHLRGGAAGQAAKHVQFSPCGKYLLVRTPAQLLLLDAFDGELICDYPVGGGPGQTEAAVMDNPPVPSFSPDSQYVLSGVPGGATCIWQATNAREVTRLTGHTSAPTRVAFSPAHALVVTAAETLAWWIPDTA